MATMLAWQKHVGSLEAVQREVAIPQCPENGFLVKILAAGVCHVSLLLSRPICGVIAG